MFLTQLLTRKRPARFITLTDGTLGIYQNLVGVDFNRMKKETVRIKSWRRIKRNVLAGVLFVLLLPILIPVAFFYTVGQWILNEQN
jgi:hypothetical protein